MYGLAISIISRVVNSPKTFYIPSVIVLFFLSMYATASPLQQRNEFRPRLMMFFIFSSFAMPQQSSSEYSMESDLDSLGPSVNINHARGGGGVGGPGGGVGGGARLKKKRDSQAS